MPILETELRNKLEKVVIDARDAAEEGARAALEALAVHHHEPYAHMKPQQRALRKHLRARARQLGDHQDKASGRLSIDHLVNECAYEHWHRILFARFLAENNLLIEPGEKIPISLSEAEELAKEEGMDMWIYASHCAQEMLPQIFRPDDPLLQVSLATEHRLKLERLLASLPVLVFTSSDALGWVYQFWQSKKKDEVNRSEVKIGADEISAVTQLFTEPYMVDFLYHNTLGAWWASKKLAAKDAASAKMEAELRAKVALPGVDWKYLRFVRGTDGKGGPWHPAGGTFDGWPKTAAALKVLDPCCGSGHFLVAGLHLLVPIRMVEEGLTAAQAVDAVLRDNLHGLEIDERCCQIAAFALAFAAWTYPGASGYRQLPILHIACTGIGPQSTAAEWVKLAEQSGIPIPTAGREAIKNGLLNLHRLFTQAPTLGSLIDPASLPADLTASDFSTVEPYLDSILDAEQADDELREHAIAAAGMVRSAVMLRNEYALVITNVPYLGRKRHGKLLSSYADAFSADGKADLATIFLDRLMRLLRDGGTVAAVTPQTWLFLRTYKRFRVRLLSNYTWNAAVRLGEHAFENPSAAGAFAAMVVMSAALPTPTSLVSGIDVSASRDQPAIYCDQKARLLRDEEPLEIGVTTQAVILRNPDAIVTTDEVSSSASLGMYADITEGLSRGDAEQFDRFFWELPRVLCPKWAFMLNSPARGTHYDGRETVFLWEDGAGRLAAHPSARIQGQPTWGRDGVFVGRTGTIKTTLSLGEIHAQNGVAVVPKDPRHLAAVVAYLRSQEFIDIVRKLNDKIIIPTGVVQGAPFDLERWVSVARKVYPKGLPEPESNDPTQWLFHGWPGEAADDTALQVAVGRLLGYRWPAELDLKMRLSKRTRALVKRCAELSTFVADDGIVCIPAVRGEEPAADRLLALLDAGELEFEGDLDDWLRNEFFEEHCKLFHDSPFLWHIWDGRKRDGFHALVNYHKLCEGGGKGRRLLESLTFAYLGEWITRQRDGVKRGEGGAEDRLAAAIELQNRLKAILDGEPPFDIFVRWKPFSSQAIGWEPDIDDGLRVNIRPFLASDLPNGRAGAGILRCRPNVNWAKDRGTEPACAVMEFPWFWNWDGKAVDFAGRKTFSGVRVNDCHYTTRAKRKAREVARRTTK